MCSTWSILIMLMFHTCNTGVYSIHMIYICRNAFVIRVYSIHMTFVYGNTYVNIGVYSIYMILKAEIKNH